MRATTTADTAVNILCYVHIHNIRYGTGTGRFAREVVGRFARKSAHQIKILASRCDYAANKIAEDSIWRSMDYCFFDGPFSRQQRTWFLRDHPRAEDFWSDVELVHCPAESFVPTHAAKSVVTLHDAALFESWAHVQDGSLLWQRWKWRLLFSKLRRHVSAFHTVSNFSAERLSHFFPSISNRIFVVPNGVANIFFETPPPESRGRLNLLGLGDRRIVFLPSGLNYRKNADLAIKAWARLIERNRDIVLVVTGKSEERFVERLHTFGDRARSLGYLNDETLWLLYYWSDLVWFPSRYEGFGIPVLEAMACGTPVVASSSSAIPEVAGDAALLAPMDDIGAHVTAIESVLRDTSTARELAQKGKCRAGRYTWDATADKLLKMFAKV